MGKCRMPIIGGGSKHLKPYGYEEVKNVAALQRLEEGQFCKVATSGAYKSAGSVSGYGSYNLCTKVSDTDTVYCLPRDYRYNTYDSGYIKTTFYSTVNNTVQTKEISQSLSSSYSSPDYLDAWVIDSNCVMHFSFRDSSLSCIIHRYVASSNTATEVTTSSYITGYSNYTGGSRTDFRAYDSINDVAYIRVEDIGSYSSDGDVTYWYGYTYFKITNVKNGTPAMTRLGSAGGDYSVTSKAAKVDFIMMLTGANASKALVRCNGKTYAISLASAPVTNLISGATAIDSISTTMFVEEQPYQWGETGSYYGRYLHFNPFIKKVSSTRAAVFNKYFLLFNSETGKLVSSAAAPMIGKTGSATVKEALLNVVVSTPSDTIIWIGSDAFYTIKFTNSSITITSGTMPTNVNYTTMVCKEYVKLSDSVFKIKSYSSYNLYDYYLVPVAYLSTAGYTPITTASDAITTKAMDAYTVGDLYAGQPV